MDVVLEKFCQGCGTRHNGMVWYYRPSMDINTRVWLCDMRYLLLDLENKQLWKIGTGARETSDGSSSRVPISVAHELNTNKGGEVIRVLLVDDHAMIRQGLRSYLSTYYRDLEVVGEAGSGEEALQVVHKLSPSVVVMDINMPGLNGIEVTARIKHTHPHVGVVGLSMHLDEDYRREMIAAGATAVISKADVVEELYDAIIKCVCASE